NRRTVITSPSLPETSLTRSPTVFLSSRTYGCSSSVRSAMNFLTWPPTILARTTSGVPSAAACSSAIERCRATGEAGPPLADSERKQSGGNSNTAAHGTHGPLGVTLSEAKGPYLEAWPLRFAQGASRTGLVSLSAFAGRARGGGLGAPVGIGLQPRGDGLRLG